jgi:hypothetical protein
MALSLLDPSQKHLLPAEPAVRQGARVRERNPVGGDAKRLRPPPEAGLAPGPEGETPGLIFTRHRQEMKSREKTPQISLLNPSYGIERG